jgi:hypothetical protein
MTVHTIIVKLKNFSGRVEVMMPSLCIEEIEGSLPSICFSTQNLNEGEFTAIRFLAKFSTHLPSSQQSVRMQYHDLIVYFKS